MPDRLALYSGGSKDGLLVRTDVLAREIKIMNINGGIERHETYRFEHLEFDGRRYHLWMFQHIVPGLDYAEHFAQRVKWGIRTLALATASERAAVECLPGSPCGLTATADVIE